MGCALSFFMMDGSSLSPGFEAQVGLRRPASVPRKADAALVSPALAGVMATEGDGDRFFQDSWLYLGRGFASPTSVNNSERAIPKQALVQE